MTAELGDDLLFRHVGFHFFVVIGEVYFTCYDGVEPASDDFPDAWANISCADEVKVYDLPWNIQGALWTRTTPRDSG